jgi:hypothetical protein
MRENTRNTRRTRASAISGNRSARFAPPSRRGGEDARGFTGLRFPMEDNLSACRARRLEGQAASRSQAQINDETTPQARAAAPERPLCLRVSDRPMDAETHRRANREAVRRLLRSIRCLARAKKHGLELPEAGTKGPRTRRAGHCCLAKEGLAAHKKTPEETVVASVFWMRAALCSSRWSVVHGLPKAARPFSIAGTDGIASRPSRRLRFRRSVDDWACTLPCTTTISVTRRWKPSRRVCWNICHMGSFWSWTVRSHIVRPLDGSGSGFLADCGLNGSLRTPRNSTLMSRYGRGLSMETWPISSRRMPPTWSEPSEVRSNRPRPTNSCCVRFSNTQSSGYEYFVCLFKGQ